MNLQKQQISEEYEKLKEQVKEKTTIIKFAIQQIQTNKEQIEELMKKIEELREVYNLPDKQE